MTDENQSRLQDHGVDTGPAPVDDPAPSCERCGDVLEANEQGVRDLTRAEQMGGVVDIHRSTERDLCEECVQLERYLNWRYAELVEKAQNHGAVVVFCECQDPDEVDVQPLRNHELIGDRTCSRCGSSEVVIEELPVSPPTLEEVNL
jgi:hypothetical protein